MTDRLPVLAGSGSRLDWKGPNFYVLLFVSLGTSSGNRVYSCWYQENPARRRSQAVEKSAHAKYDVRSTAAILLATADPAPGQCQWREALPKVKSRYRVKSSVKFTHQCVHLMRSTYLIRSERPHGNVTVKSQENR